MIEQIRDQLDKIESTFYEGQNADALREMDLQDLRTLIEHAIDEEHERDRQMDDIKEDLKTLDEAFEVFNDEVINLRDAVGDVKRHFRA